MSITAASPPIAGSPGDLWYDSGNGNRRNECAASQSWSFGTGTGSWAGGHASVAQGNFWPDGTAALLVTADGTGVSGWYGSSTSVPCVAGDMAAAQATVYVPDPFDASLNLLQVYAGLAWLDDTGTLISVTSGTTQAVAVYGQATVTVTGTAPSGAASVAVVAGDAEDSPAGAQLLVQSASVAVWSPYQAGTSAIANAAVTAPLLATGAVTAASISAGAIDGMSITGAKIVADGTSGEFLAYSGTPALGNLIASVSAATATDAYGNKYLAGITNYVNLGSSMGAVGIIDGLMTGYTASSPGGPWSSATTLDFSDPARLTINAQALILAPPISAPLAALKPGTTNIAESWHTLTPGNSWTGTFSYRLTPENEVQMSAVLTAPGSSPNGTTIVTLPSGYLPASLHGVGSTALTVGTGGAVKGATVTAGATVYVEARIPLDI